jgi:Predicted integral membrane protein
MSFFDLSIIISTFFIIPIMMIVFGVLWRKGGPKKINDLYGYRTTRSMASREAWDFAHIYSGKLFLIIGISQLILLVPICVYYWSFDDALVGTVPLIVLTIQMFLFILIIPMTELALKKNFDKNGKYVTKQK